MNRQWQGEIMLTTAEQEILKLIRKDPTYSNDIYGLASHLFVMDHCVYGEAEKALITTQEMVDKLRLLGLI